MNDKGLSIKCCQFVTAAFLLLIISLSTSAQQNETGQSAEVFLTFQYKGVVSVYTTAYFENDQFYLPVSELFNVLNIDHSVDQGRLAISGTYPGGKSYIFDFRSPDPRARAGETEISLTVDDFLIKDIDYFVRPEIFNRLFGLEFEIDFNNLTLDLTTEDKMPVVAQYEREQKRRQLEERDNLFSQEYSPLKFDRSHARLDGAFLDYNLSTVFTDDNQILTLSNALGIEVLGGDLQGNTFATLSNEQTNFTTDRLRWRYVQRDKPLFTSGIIGQTNSEGISNRAITGVKISNKPVEARKLFDQFAIDGTVAPQSEVELYLNNQLIDFQESDQSGNYRFVVPLTYGSTDYSVRVFNNEGQTIDRNTRIQIPFDYVPSGEVDYTASIGRLDNPVLGSDNDRGVQAEATVAAGLSNRITAEASAEYLSSFHDNIPSFTGTLNARLFSNYLVSLNANSENFYRFTSNVIYSSGASWNLSYDFNPGESRLFNPSGNDQEARVNIFTPFSIGNLPLNLRWSSNYQKNDQNQLLRYRVNLSSRISRLNIRLGYQDQQTTPLSFTSTSSSRLTNSYTLTMGRSRKVPDFFRSAFIRTQFSYLPGLSEFEEAEIQFSREVFDGGRIQITASRNFLSEFNSVSLNFTLDFNKVRSNTTTRITNSQPSVNQSIRGSIGYDPYGEQFVFNNRQQVGQAGTAIRLYVDNNNDGIYQDTTDEIIDEPAVRVSRTGGRTSSKKGVNYVSQLLPYYRYNVEINRSALENPLLIPDVERFSIITDPNQYKPLEIPFYLSGVISGRVEQIEDSNSTPRPLGGVRVMLESEFDSASTRGPVSKEIRTFSDGSFYDFEIPPGKYRLFIDPNQLEFLNVNADPDTLRFEVEALAQGDFKENLNFTLRPLQGKAPADTALSNKKTTTPNPPGKTDTEEEHTDSSGLFQVQLASYSTLKTAGKAEQKAEQLFGHEFYLFYNRVAELFGLRSNFYHSRKEALEKLFTFQKSVFSEPALVVITGDKEIKEKESYSAVEVGSYHSEIKAREFAVSVEKELERDVFIHQDSTSSRFRVHILKETSSSRQEKELRNLKERAIFKDSYINRYSTESNKDYLAATALQFRYQIHIEGIETDSLQAFRDSLADDFISGSKLIRTEADRIVFENIGTWNEVVQLKYKLSNLSTGFSPVMVLVEDG